MKLYLCTGQFTRTEPVSAEGPSQACEKYARLFAPTNGYVHVKCDRDSWMFNVAHKAVPSFTIKRDRERSRSI